MKADLEVPDGPHARPSLELEIITDTDLMSTGYSVLLYIVQREVERVCHCPGLVDLIVEESDNLCNSTVRHSHPELIGEKDGAGDVHLQRSSGHEADKGGWLNLIVIDDEYISAIDISMQILESDDISNLLLVRIVLIGEELGDCNAGEVTTRLRVEEQATEAEIEAKLTNPTIEYRVAIIDSHSLVGVIYDILKANLQAEPQLVAPIETEAI